MTASSEVRRKGLTIMSTRRSPHHRHTGVSRYLSRRRNTLSAMLHITLGSRRGAWIRLAGGAALALLLAVGLLCVGQSTSHQVAAAAPAQRAWMGRANAPEFPPTLHFYDLRRNTAYTVWLRNTA